VDITSLTGNTVMHDITLVISLDLNHKGNIWDNVSSQVKKVDLLMQIYYILCLLNIKP